MKKNKNILPKGEAQLKHIFTKREGHLEDTFYNRTKIIEIINNQQFYIGQDMYGCKWFVEETKTGGQYWAKVYNHTLSDAGFNTVVHIWNEHTGLCNNIN